MSRKLMKAAKRNQQMAVLNHVRPEELAPEPYIDSGTSDSVPLSERLEIRLTPDEKVAIENAAMKDGRSVSSFVRQQLKRSVKYFH